MTTNWLGKTIEYDDLAWVDGVEFHYTGLLDIEEFDGSAINCWVSGEPQTDDAPDRGWVAIDQLPEAIYEPGKILPNVDGIKSSVFDCRFEFEDWLDDIFNRRLGINLF